MAPGRCIAAEFVGAVCGPRAVPAFARDVPANAGIRFVHFNGMPGELHSPGIVGQGAALFDDDTDGDLEISFGEGRVLGPGAMLVQAIFPPPGSLAGDRLYRNDLSILADGSRVGRFTDVSEAAGLHGDGFGSAWVDYDNDGWLDLFVVNGAVCRMGEAKIMAGSFPLRQTNQILANLGNGCFREVTQDAGAAFGTAAVGRGAAIGHIDNDGGVDVLVAVEIDSGRTLWRPVHADGSYASASDPRLVVGLGQAKARGVRVLWSSGRTEAWPPPAEGRYTVLREGGGKQEGRAVRGTTSSR